MRYDNYRPSGSSQHIGEVAIVIVSVPEKPFLGQKIRRLLCGRCPWTQPTYGLYPNSSFDDSAAPVDDFPLLFRREVTEERILGIGVAIGE